MNYCLKITQAISNIVLKEYNLPVSNGIGAELTKFWFRVENSIFGVINSVTLKHNFLI